MISQSSSSSILRFPHFEAGGSGIFVELYTANEIEVREDSRKDTCVSTLYNGERDVPSYCSAC